MMEIISFVSWENLVCFQENMCFYQQLNKYWDCPISVPIWFVLFFYANHLKTWFSRFWIR